MGSTIKLINPNHFQPNTHYINNDALKRDGIAELIITTSENYTTYKYIKMNNSSTTLKIHNTLIPEFIYNYAGYPQLWYSKETLQRYQNAKMTGAIRVYHEH